MSDLVYQKTWRKRKGAENMINEPAASILAIVNFHDLEVYMTAGRLELLACMGFLLVGRQRRKKGKVR
jgi:hypothetical protein